MNKLGRKLLVASLCACMGGGFTYGLWFQGRKGSGYCGR